MQGKDSYRIQAIITKKERQEIEQIAKKQNRSVSNLIALMIRDYLKKHK